MQLIQEWLQSVNQPVVDEVCDKINQLLETISDNSNFDQHNVNKFYLKF
jgi:hypothetical protein